ncbi:galactokinase [Nocardioides ginsengisoli]|uniref:Galactokinase n=1 Tax=Nocardioides ginsengisoli TaxID=363868 RepID=A0ABW3W000_9ACTN
MTSAQTVTAVAPGRVNLIGEHTDYNGGRCLPFALPVVTMTTVTARADDLVTVSSRQSGTWEGTLADVSAGVTGWAAYVAGVVWALRDAGWPVGGLSVEIDSSVPLGAGLSSSASLECAVATGIAGLLGRPLDRAGRLELAELCRRAETEYVGAPTGGMDQLASMLGAPDTALLLDFAGGAAAGPGAGPGAGPAVTAVPLPLAATGLAVLVTESGVRHELADGDGGYAQRRRECEAGDERRMRHVRSEDARVEAAVAAIAASDWETLGTLMTASHVSLRDDFEVSIPRLDVAVAAALDGGALGARLTGGGFGGCTIALVRADETGVVRAAIDAAYRDAGWPAPSHRLVLPAAGARLVEPVPGRGR